MLWCSLFHHSSQRSSVVVTSDAREPQQLYTPQPTADGSSTFFSPAFGELFHSHHGAYQEAHLKFVLPTGLLEKAQRPRLTLLDICYGLGYNSAAALEAIWQINPDCEVTLIGLELDLAVPQAAIAHQVLQVYPQPVQAILAELATTQRCDRANLRSRLFIGDARQWLHNLVNPDDAWPQNPPLPSTLELNALDIPLRQVDAVFLDPFSPPRCPQLWTVEFLGLISRTLAYDGTVATYSAAAAVRATLQQLGLHLGSTSPVGRQVPGTAASFSPVGLPPLSQQELEHLQTKAAVPYRDPHLSDDAETIHQRRALEQAQSPLEPASKWRKRWADRPSSFPAPIRHFRDR